MKKIIIGITGSFGSGKTTVARMLNKTMKAELLDADRIARDITKRMEIRKKIKKHFGTTDRNRLSEIVFSDSSKLKKMNQIVHPAVKKKINDMIKNSNKKIIIIDIPLIFEAGMQGMFDAIIVVRCRKCTQIKRLAKRGFKRSDVLRRIKSQMPLSQKVRFATYIIDNNGSLSETKEQVRKIMNKTR